MATAAIVYVIESPLPGVDARKEDTAAPASRSATDTVEAPLVPHVSRTAWSVQSSPITRRPFLHTYDAVHGSWPLRVSSEPDSGVV